MPGSGSSSLFGWTKQAAGLGHRPTMEVVLLRGDAGSLERALRLLWPSAGSESPGPRQPFAGGGLGPWPHVPGLPGGPGPTPCGRGT